MVILDNVIFKGEHHFIHLQIFYLFLIFVTYYLSLKSFQLYGIYRTIMFTIEHRNITVDKLIDDEDGNLRKLEIKILHEPEFIKAKTYPFFGSGTVGVACKIYGLSYVGIKLNPNYATIARNRLKNAKFLRIDS